MEVYAELTEPNSSCIVGTQGANTGTNFQNMSGSGGVVGADTNADLYVPLRFYFCRNAGLALPLIALQYVKKLKLLLSSTQQLTLI